MEDEYLIEYSPITCHHAENDKEYSLQVASDEPEQGSFFLGQNQADLFALNGEANSNWHDAPTKLMLSLLEEMRPKLGKSVQVKTKSKMYQAIAGEMFVEGYKFTPVQIENKIRGMERLYKKTVLHNRQTGRNRQNCPYESELDRIFGKKKGIYPEFVLESGDAEGISLNKCTDYSDTENSPTDGEQSPDQFPKKRSKIGLRQQIMEKMDQMMAQKENFHSKVLDLLQKKEERAQKTEERKLDLLEKLLRK